MCRCLHSISIHRFKHSTKAEVAQLTKYFQHRFKAQKSCNNFIKTFKLQNNVHCCSGSDKNLLILQTQKLIHVLFVASYFTLLVNEAWFFMFSGSFQAGVGVTWNIKQIPLTFNSFFRRKLNLNILAIRFVCLSRNKQLLKKKFQNQSDSSIYVAQTE